MLSPEQVCAWESMKACEQRLADMGFTHVDDEDAEKVPCLPCWQLEAFTAPFPLFPCVGSFVARPGKEADATLRWM
jgi:hypothetical protein